MIRSTTAPTLRRGLVAGLSVLLLAGLVFTAGCGRRGLIRSGFVYGRITNAQGGALVTSEAAVRLGSVKSDAVRGVFQTLKLPYGAYQLTVEAEGYESRTVSVNINRAAISQNVSLILLPDATRPTVESVSPFRGASNVYLGQPAKVNFSEYMPEASAEAAFSISPAVAGTFSWVQKQLVFTPNSEWTPDTLYTVTIGTGAVDRAGNALAAPYTWSFRTGQTHGVPGVNRIAFASDREQGIFGIFTMEPDGTAITKLYSSGSGDEAPAWSPDRQKIAFTSRLGTTEPEIWVMSSDGTGAIRLTNHARQDTSPVWSPNGQEILFQSDRDGIGNWNIYAMKPDGSGLRRVTNDIGWDEAPTWSPDGSRIAFASTRSGGRRIHVVNAAGEDAGATVSGPLGEDADPFTSDTGPAWSPDGTRIAFTSDRTGDWEIYVMNADGANVRRLTNYPIASDTEPAWSLDCTSIVFVSNRNGNYELYKIDVATGAETRLTQDLVTDQHSDYNPDWYR